MKSVGLKITQYKNIHWYTYVLYYERYSTMELLLVVLLIVSDILVFFFLPVWIPRSEKLLKNIFYLYK